MEPPAAPRQPDLPDPQHGVAEPKPPAAAAADPNPMHDQPRFSESPAPNRGCLFSLTNAIDTIMRRSFYRLGYLVARRPLRTIVVSVAFMVATLAGMLRFRSESRAEELWVPQGTVALSNQQYVNPLYGRTTRLAAIALIRNDDAAGGSLATTAALTELASLAERALAVTAAPQSPLSDNVDGTVVTWPERCVSTTDANNNVICRSNSVLSLFYDVKDIVRYNASDSPAVLPPGLAGRVNFFATVKNHLASLTDADVRATLASPPPLAFDDSPFTAEQMYAGPAGSGPAAAGDVRVLRYYQYARNNAVVKDGELVDPENDALEERWTKFVLDEAPNALPLRLTRPFVDTSWSQEESLSEALSGDLPLLAAGFLLLAVYVVFFLGDFHAVRSHMWLALAALITTALALGTCFGLSSAFGMFFGPVHQILPLLIVGIGIDDCFHITRAVDDVMARPDSVDKPIPARIALALSTAGSAITVTSFTNVVVFLLSAISRLPALRFFSLWAAIGILFAWLYAITFYTAFVTLDARRINASRRDCVPCLVASENKELNWFRMRRGAFSRFFSDWYGPFIMRTPVRIVLLVLFAAGLGASIYGCSQLYLKFRFSFFYPDGTSQREYQDVIDTYFKPGDPSAVYLRDRSLREVENRRRYLNLCHPETGAIAKNEFTLNGTVDCWYVKLEQTSEVNLDTLSGNDFMNAVKNFLNSSDGSRYSRDIRLNSDKDDIESARFSFQYVYRETNDIEINSLKSMRESADSVGFGAAADENPAAFPFTFFDTFSEQYDALPSEIGVSLGLACVAVGVVCVILIGHPLVALVSLLVVGMIIIAVLGLTYFSDVNLNSVSVITLVLCAGISVDFVVHISRAFLDTVGTRKERAIKSLEIMGPPVFYAGFSTFLAIVVLSVAKSYIFQVIFKGFAFLLAMAFLHGLILGPVLLSFVGPRSFYATEEEKEMAEQRLEASISGGAAAQGKVVNPENENSVGPEMA